MPAWRRAGGCGRTRSTGAGSRGGGPRCRPRSRRWSAARGGRCRGARTPTSRAGPAARRPSAPTGPRSSACASCRGCCAGWGSATPPSSCSGSASRTRCCSRRSARSTSCTAAPTSPSPRAAANAGVPMIVSNQASASRWRRSRRAPGPVRAGGSSSTGRRPTTSSTASSPAPRPPGRGAVVVTLDTTVLGWRPRDLDLGHLPFARGLGIAQYTSDPVFAPPHPRDRRRVRGARPRPPTPAAVRTLVEISRNHPGALRRQPALAAAARRGGDVPAGLLASDAELGRHRDAALPHAAADRAQGRPAPRRRPPRARRRRRRGAREQPRRAPGRRVRRQPRRPARRRRGRRRARAGAARLAGCAAGPTSPARSPSARRRPCLGRPFAYGLAVAGAAGVAQVTRDVLAELDLTLALAGARTPADLELAPFATTEPGVPTPR